MNKNKLTSVILIAVIGISHAYAKDVRISSNQSVLDKQVITNLTNIAVNMRVKEPLVVLQQNNIITIQSQEQQGVKCQFKLNEAQTITSMQCN